MHDAGYARHAHCDIRSVTKLRLKGSPGWHDVFRHHTSHVSCHCPMAHEMRVRAHPSDGELAGNGDANRLGILLRHRLGGPSHPRQQRGILLA
jgi:hypothetical protein